MSGPEIPDIAASAAALAEAQEHAAQLAAQAADLREYADAGSAGTNYTVDLVEISPGGVWRFGGLPRTANARRELLTRLQSATRVAMSELDDLDDGSNPNCY